MSEAAADEIRARLPTLSITTVPTVEMIQGICQEREDLLIGLAVAYREAIIEALGMLGELPAALDHVEEDGLGNLAMDAIARLQQGRDFDPSD